MNTKFYCIKSLLKIWLLSVNFEKTTPLNEDRDQSKSSRSTVYMAVIGRGFRLYRKFLKVYGQQQNFQELLWLHSLTPLCWTSILFIIYVFTSTVTYLKYKIHLCITSNTSVDNQRNSVVNFWHFVANISTILNSNYFNQ